MDITQLSGQTYGKVHIETEGTDAKQQANASVSSRVEYENKKAAEAHKTEGTQMERMQSEVQKGQLKDLVDNLNKSLDPFNTSLKFGFNDKAETYFVSVIDTNTNDVIRKFPTEEAMQLSQKMKELVGMIFDKKG